MMVSPFEEKLSALISKKRFDHVVRVSQTAKDLANHYGYDSNKAYIAGLLHDAAKEQSPQSLRDLGVSSDLVNDSVFSMFPKVWHALVAPEFCQLMFSINDQDILSAMKFHTTGKDAMSILEQIVYVADFIEPGRDVPERQFVYDLAFESLDEACYALSLISMYSLMGRHLSIHPFSLACYNYYQKCSKKRKETQTTILSYHC
jgi:predicted HD superfamily hydrolase involved in NAD metabolism